MTIDRIGGIDPIQPGKKPNRSDSVKENGNEDIISISPAAREKAELYRIRELAIAAPDIREERIAELREKINDPAYINDRLLGETADRILEALLGT
ncbi:MAG: flagellar biosynthesis anti-sigma factor FlgM [Treponema sp.]|jgi:negative regulator of flagellin synthesis FlgM|nr:flagellar biosynthesis anti-sigma factor FlgM [Treponema sp.]